MNARPAFERIVQALEAADSQVRSGGGRVKAQCPAHDDRNPSLSVTGIAGQALVYCHAGCRTGDVLAAIGLVMADLYDDPRGASYHYDDGRVVTRTPDKQFRQSGNTKGRPTLFRSGKVTEAVAAGAAVFVVEGEKDVLALESLGVVATTAPMGANNFGKVDVSPLRGATVVVVPDQDAAGKRWLHDVMAVLADTAAAVEVRAPREGKDVAEHVAAGLGVSDLTPHRRAGVGSRESPETKKEGRTKPPAADPRMFAGLLGEIVAAAAPTTEADPVGIFATLLAGAGVLIGDGPHLMIADTRHPLLVWPLVFGRTGAGRKGETAASASRVLRATNHGFAALSASGLSSGEGLIERIRDVADENDAGGCEDKRLFVIESEFAVVMARAKREGSTLAAVLRDAWEGKALQVMNKRSVRASSSHVAVVGHITPFEFRMRLADAEMAGGTFNRFLPVYVERSQALALPEGMSDSVVRALAQRLDKAITQAKGLGPIGLTPAARERWEGSLYPEFGADDGDDFAWTEFTRRAAPYCRRIAALHAAMDGRRAVSADDLEAAGALVRYAIGSAKFVLDRTVRDPRMDRLVRALDSAPEGLTRTEVSRLFSGNRSAEELDRLLTDLVETGEYEVFEEPTGGRPAQRYRAERRQESSRRPQPEPIVLPSFFVLGGPDGADPAASCLHCGTRLDSYLVEVGETLHPNCAEGVA